MYTGIIEIKKTPVYLRVNAKNANQKLKKSLMESLSKRKEKNRWRQST